MSRLLSIIVLLVTGVIFYGLTLRGTAGNFTQLKELDYLAAQVGSPFESSHEKASYAEMLRMREADTPELAYLKDFAAPDVGFRDGKYYSYFPPGVSYFIRPFFELGYPYNHALLAAYSSMITFGVLTMVFIYLISRNVFGLPSYIGISAALIYGFGTTAWSYAITIFQHAPSAFFAMVMFYGVARYRARIKTSALWASIVWLTYGISIWFDYPNGLLLSPFIVYYVLSAIQINREEQALKVKFDPSHFTVAIWFVIPIALHLLFNAIYMGSPFTLRQNFDRYDPALSRLLLEQETKNKVLTVTSEEVAPAVEQRSRMPFLEEVVVSGFYTLTISPDKGIFFFSPVLLFGIWGLYLAFRKKQTLEHSIMLAFIIINMLTYASFGDPYGGWAFGPRYLIPAMTALAIYAGYALHELRNPFMRALFYASFLFSLSVAAAGALTTNNVPPKVEAVYLGKEYYNYLLNFNLIDTQQTSNFIFNTYLQNTMSLSEYYILIVLSLGLIIYGVLFIFPLLRKPKK